MTLNEVILRNLLQERMLAIQSGNKERQEVLEASIKEHERMMAEEDIKEHK